MKKKQREKDEEKAPAVKADAQPKDGPPFAPEAEAAVPMLTLRADNTAHFRALIHLAHYHDARLRSLVREWELWREANF